MKHMRTDRLHACWEKETVADEEHSDWSEDGGSVDYGEGGDTSGGRRR